MTVTLGHVLTEHLRPRLRTGHQLGATAAFLTSGLTELTTWLDTDAPLPPDEAYTLFKALPCKESSRCSKTGRTLVAPCSSL